jgi:thiol-disulfide isomerase/thioredoxin
VLRGEQWLRLSLVPKPYPLKWPELPGPPKPGAPAPPLSLGAYRGTLPATLADGTPHLLFFWATWCAPCKASLPELLAFEKDRHTPVVAITDEPSEQLDTFFKHFRDPFPATVGVDEERRAFLAYGVSGTPTFVLVDGEGRVQAVTDGYRPDHGLGIEGWSWTKPAEAGRLTGPGSP